MSTEENKNTYKLAKPIAFDGQQVEILTFEFDELTGKDLLACAKQAQAMDPQDIAPVKAFSLHYQVVIASRAAGVVPELILALKGRDFTEATQRAQNFLLGAE